MAKLTAWLVTLIGVLLVLQAALITVPYNSWLIALLVLVIGVAKLLRNYKKK